jgi:hypothetical protein
MLSRVWHHQGAWNHINGKEKRHEFKLAHGFRKFFETRTRQSMKHNNVKIMMGNSSSMSLKNYYKPTEKEVLDDYLRAVGVLTFSANSETLNKKVEDLEEQNKNTDYIIKGNLQEKDEKVNRLIKGLFETTDQKHANSVTRSLFSTGIIKQIES